jgi:hypothetical protein
MKPATADDPISRHESSSQQNRPTSTEHCRTSVIVNRVYIFSGNIWSLFIITIRFMITYLLCGNLGDNGAFGAS